MNDSDWAKHRERDAVDHTRRIAGTVALVTVNAVLVIALLALGAMVVAVAIAVWRWAF